MAKQKTTENRKKIAKGAAKATATAPGLGLGQVFLRGERVTLRPLEPSDAPVYAAMYNDPDVRVTFFTNTPLNLHLAKARLEDYYKPGADSLPLAIVRNDTGAAVGLSALVRIDWVSAMATYMICISDSSAWGRGLGGETTELMLHYAFNILNLHRVQLIVFAGNPAAIRAYEKAGFVREGVLREAMKHNGEWADFIQMGVLEHEWRARQGKK